MQTTTSLAQNLHALYVHLMRSANGEVFRALGELDLSMSQVKALHVLDAAEAEDVSLAALAEEVGLSLPAASRAVDGLLVRGFVERREDPEDRRARRVRILEPGREITRRLSDAKLSHFEAFAESLPREDAERLADAVARCLP